MEQSESLIRVKNLEVSYGQETVLKGISLDIPKGEILVLIGSNGAGKSTIMKTILGVTQPKAGEITFKGQDITRSSVDQNVRLGISLVPEGRGVFPSMSVMDNLLLGAHYNLQNASKKMDTIFDTFPVLEQRKGQVAGTLSGGEQRLLAISRALMSSPEVILMDEPSIGLAPILVKEIFDILTNLNHRGYTILLAEQKARKALRCAHRGCILEAGSIIREGSSEALLNDPAIVETYTGISESP